MQQDRLVKEKKRVLFLDILRGLAILNAVMYHLLYDLVYIFGVSVSWFSIRKCFVWQQSICITFILISGISFRLSRRPWKSILVRAGCAILLSVVTLVVIPEEVVVFGIIHFLGSAFLIAWLCRPLLRKIPTWLGLSISLFLFVFIRNISEGSVGIPGLWEYHLPVALYDNHFMFWTGFPSADFYSADYFPILPWIMLFFTGCFGGIWWIKGSSILTARQEPLDEKPIYRLLDKSLGAAGRKSLWIYMIHQPILYGALLFLQKMDWLNG